MIAPELLAILCCPESHQELELAPPALIANLNQEIAAGKIRNVGGAVLTEAIDGGLIRADRKVLYPIRHKIPVLLIDEGIPLA